MSLEQQVTRGCVTSVYPTNCAVHPSELVLELVDNCEIGEVTRLLKFSSIRSYSEQWDEEADHGGIQSLIGLDEYPEDAWTRYVIAMDEVEIAFTSAEAPVIVEL